MTFQRLLLAGLLTTQLSGCFEPGVKITDGGPSTNSVEVSPGGKFYIDNQASGYAHLYVPGAEATDSVPDRISDMGGVMSAKVELGLQELATNGIGETTGFSGSVTLPVAALNGRRAFFVRVGMSELYKIRVVYR